MAVPPDARRVKSDLLDLLRRVPPARVVTVDLLAATVGVIPHVVLTALSSLTDDERTLVPWHRAVAKGGAIGRGPHRDAQFARLVREGVPVSPAGIVQDMVRTAITELPPPGQPGARCAEVAPVQSPPPPAPPSRSRGMKDRPT